MKTRKLNWRTISSDIAEAREELENLEQAVKSGELPSEAEFQTRLQHAYHHLNFAWNARHKTTKRYASLTDADFRAWDKYPKDIES